MNVLLLGSGGREHALAWKIAQSPLLTKLFIAPGNGGTRSHGKNVDIDLLNFNSIKDFVLANVINLVIVGPEEPLVAGIVDFFNADTQLTNVNILGPSKAGAMLEGSKDFAKVFMKKYNIPTAAYKSFTKNELNQAHEFLNTQKAPFVIKADGLAAGKGVVICNDVNEAKEAINAMLLHEKFGNAGQRIIIEQFLNGIELSVFAITDGTNYVLLPEAKDYKKVGEGDKGLNTGGMGAISPVPFADKAFMSKVIAKVVEPTIYGIMNEKINFKGFVFFGLIKVDNEPYVIEYNTRMGDPETQVVIPRIDSDILSLFMNVFNTKLNQTKIEISNLRTSTVILASNGYPESYEKEKIIYNCNKVEESIVFHAGTIYNSNTNCTLTNGGRVLALTSFGNSLSEALSKSNKSADIINFENKYFRKDIGFEFV